MPQTPVAHQVNHHIFLELLAVFQRQFGGVHHRFGIIAIDVENRRVNHFCHVSRVISGATIRHCAGGKTDLVVNHNMDRATGAITACLRHIKGFHDHALPRKGRITVDGNTQHLITVFIVTTILTRPHRAFHYRADDLQMRWVKRQHQMHRAAFGTDIAGKTFVVFHIAGISFVDFALKLAEQFTRWLTQHIGQYIESPPVRHTNRDFL